VRLTHKIGNERSPNDGNVKETSFKINCYFNIKVKRPKYQTRGFLMRPTSGYCLSRIFIFAARDSCRKRLLGFRPYKREKEMIAVYEAAVPDNAKKSRKIGLAVFTNAVLLISALWLSARNSFVYLF